ncbi:hypothetical protein IV500_05010 [Paeniglutamicibacter antarcticus]|uniref:Uncharacterized protein n=1 Tax=Arthrobacter terrae TaxID=2935737 RepID=A0A931G4G8_9MICC|nr:hypothetical protein [Arthrobacter terrae]MBG0738778.1 hypothetical protein [Arthrobacter terrae]
MTVAVAYKSTAPTVVDTYLQAREEIVAVWRTSVDAFQESVGGHEIHGTAFFDGGWAVQGFYTPNSFAEIPDGWRREGKFKAVLAKRTPEGRAAAATLTELRLPGNHYPGVPAILHAENHAVFPRIVTAGKDHFLTLSIAPLDEPNNAVDRGLWEPVKLSAFHAAVEAAEMVAL